MALTTRLFVLLGLAALAAGKLQIPKIQRLKQESEVLRVQNAAAGPSCFPVYTPKLDSIAQQYETQYNFCDTQFAEQTALEDSKWEQPRQDLLNSGKYACSLIADCSTVVGTVEAFECYARVGADQSKTMYTISSNAVEASVDIEQYYQKLTASRDICINNAERTYVETTASTYEELNACLRGDQPITTGEPQSTPWPTETTRTTAISDSSTETSSTN